MESPLFIRLVPEKINLLYELCRWCCERLNTRVRYTWDYKILSNNLNLLEFGIDTLLPGNPGTFGIGGIPGLGSLALPGKTTTLKERSPE